jgi:hypothetical protein
MEMSGWRYNNICMLLHYHLFELYNINFSGREYSVKPNDYWQNILVRDRRGG